MTKALAGALLTAILLGSCTSEASEPVGKEKELAAKTADFALKFHGEALRRNPTGNVFLSPVSAFFALSMAASGASGVTRDEMAAALEVQGWSREDIDRSCSALLKWLRHGEPNVRLEVANSAWVNQDFPFHRSYVKQLEDFYQADAATLDFKDAESLDRINSWASDKTQGKIPQVAPAAFDPLDVLLLVNAVYFKGAWEREFRKSMTRNQDFTLADGTKKSLPFMRRSASFEVLDTDPFEAIRIPYGEKHRIQLVIALPKKGGTLLQLHQQLAAQWRDLKGKFASQYCDLELPRFKLEFGMRLNDVCIALGMKNAFSRASADFSALSPRGKELYISSVIQKTFVEVNEEGTEAAAITKVLVAAKAAEPAPLRVFRVDHPFFCAIVDDVTGALLFTGSIAAP